MRIVEYGHIKPEIVKCNYCGAILEYIPKDFKEVLNTYFLTCPVCKHYIYTNNDGRKFTIDDLKEYF